MVVSIGSSAAIFPNTFAPTANIGRGGDTAVTNLSSGDSLGNVTSASLQANSSVASSQKTSSNTSSSGSSKAANGEELTEEEERVVQELKQRDAEVRAHEQAHASAGGTYASAPSYEYTVGPDGKRYATSGEVQIDTAPVRDNPEATIRKMDIVIRAALAPAEPSSQDLQVARQAQQTRASAQAELAEQRLQELRDSNEAGNGESDPNRVPEANSAYNTALSLQQGQNPDELAQQLFSVVS